MGTFPETAEGDVDLAVRTREFRVFAGRLYGLRLHPIVAWRLMEIL